MRLNRKILASVLSIALFGSCFSDASANWVAKAGTVKSLKTELTLEDTSIQTENVVENLSGNISESEQVKTITYAVYSEDNVKVDGGDATITGDTFTAEEVKLQEGVNRVVFTAEDQSGNETTKEMEVKYDAGEVVEPETKHIKEDEKGTKYVNNSILITFSLDSTEEERNTVIESVNGTVIGQINAIKCYQVKIGAKTLEEIQVLGQELQKKYPTLVMSAVADVIRDVCIYEPEDPFDDGQDWTEDMPSGSNWGFEAIEAGSAWEDAEQYLDEKTNRFTNVTTGVVDDGFDVNHEDIGQVVSYAYQSTESIAANHGSHTSGIVGARWNNGKGIAGMCPSDIILESVQDDQQTLPDSFIAKGLTSAVEKGAKTINFSIGSYVPYTGNAEGFATMMASLVKQGYDFLYVKAAGNNSYDAYYGGDFASITNNIAEKVASKYGIKADDILKRKIVVAAIGQKNNNEYELAKFTNYGKQIDVGAPGVDIYSLVADGKYANYSGTSMAAPFVTGLAGLIWGVNDSLTGPEVYDIICDQKNQREFLKDKDGNTISLVSAKKCVQAAYKDSLHINEVKVGDGSKKFINLGSTVSLSIDAQHAVSYGYRVTRDHDVVTLEKKNTNDTSIAWTPDTFGKHTITFYAKDSNGSVAHQSVEINVVSDSENELKITNFTTSKESIAVAGATELTAKVTGGKAPYTYRFGTMFQGETYYSNGAYLSSEAAGEFFTTDRVVFSPSILLDINGNTDAIGMHKLFVEVKDSEGTLVKKVIKKYNVVSLEATGIQTSESSPAQLGASITLQAQLSGEVSAMNLTEKFTIQRGNDEEVVLPVENDSHSVLWLPEKSGVYTITYDVEDTLGQTASTAIKYQVIKEENSTVVYYRYTGNETPNIHYRVGNGNWTTAPGTPMTISFDKDDYNFKAVIPLADSDVCTVCFNYGKGNWDNNNRQNYVLHKGVYGIANGKIEDLKNEMRVSFNVNFESGSKYNLRADYSVSAGSGSYRAEVTCINERGQEIPAKFENENYNDVYETLFGDVHFTPREVGEYTIRLKVTDSNGQVEIRTQKKSLLPYSFSVSTDLPSPQKVGTPIYFKAHLNNMKIADMYCTVGYFVLKDEKMQILPWNASNDKIWTPEEAGHYIIFAYLVDVDGDVGSQVIEYDITEDDVQTPSPSPTIEPDNKAVVYYANNSWNQAYIHFRTENGTWTKVPGVKMEKTDEVDGYNWKYEIDLGDASKAEVCFNNGNGSWDSRNSSNYIVTMGRNGIKNQNVYKLPDITPTVTPTITPTVTPTVTPTITPTVTPTITPTVTPTVTPTITPTVTPIEKKVATVFYNNDSWNAAYIHYRVEGGEWTNVPGVKMESNNEKAGYKWKFKIDLQNASKAEVCFNNGNGNWDSRNGSNYIVSEGTSGIKNGTVTSLSNQKNEVTVYYKNTSWSNGYIHFCVEGGAWTAVPGIKMDKSDRSDYTWMYKIDLGDAANAVACFNNGSGSWDSKNGQNYTLTKGTVGIKNGIVTTINE